MLTVTVKLSCQLARHISHSQNHCPVASSAPNRQHSTILAAIFQHYLFLQQLFFHTSWMLFQTLSQQCGCTEGITRYTTVLCKAMNKPFPSTFWSSYYSNLVQSNTNAHCHKATRQLVWVHLMAGLTQVYEIYGYTSVVVLIVQSVKIQSNQCSSTELLQSGLGSPKQNLWGILRTASSQAGHCYCCSANSVKALTPTTENYHWLFLREWTYRSLHYGGSLTLQQQQQPQLATKQWAKKTQTNWWNA